MTKVLWSKFFFMIQVLYCIFRFGRRPTVCATYIPLTIVALCIAWTPNIGVYMLLRGLLGCIATGSFLPGFVLGRTINFDIIIFSFLNICLPCMLLILLLQSSPLT